MTSAVALALVAAIASIATLFVSINNGRRLSTIHTLTNSNLLKVTDALQDANSKIEGLRQLLGATYGHGGPLP